MFDPYHKWLGIPKDQRPPTYYQLLGITPGEEDVEVIEEAAIRQTTHVRAYQIGAHAKECTQLLNEISQARSTLTNPTKRKQYDATLPQKAKEKLAGMPGPANQVTAVSPGPKAEMFADLEATELIPAGKKPLVKAAAAGSNKTLIYAAAGVGAVAVLAIVLVVAMSGGSKEGTQHAQNPDKTKPKEKLNQKKNNDKNLKKDGFVNKEKINKEKVDGDKKNGVVKQEGMELMKKVVGRYNLSYSGEGFNQKGETRWQFTEGRAFENGKEKGTWYVQAGKVVITYFQDFYGKAVLEFKDDNTLVGRHEQKNGQVFNWVLTREGAAVPVVQGSSNGVVVKDEIDCSKNPRRCTVGKNFRLDKDWRLSFEYEVPDLEKDRVLLVWGEAPFKKSPLCVQQVGKVIRVILGDAANPKDWSGSEVPLNPDMAGKWIRIQYDQDYTNRSMSLDLGDGANKKWILGFTPKLNGEVPLWIGGDPASPRFQGRIRNVCLENMGSTTPSKEKVDPIVIGPDSSKIIGRYEIVRFDGPSPTVQHLFLTKYREVMADGQPRGNWKIDGKKLVLTLSLKNHQGAVLEADGDSLTGQAETRNGQSCAWELKHQKVLPPLENPLARVEYLSELPTGIVVGAKYFRKDGLMGHEPGKDFPIEIDGVRYRRSLFLLPNSQGKGRVFYRLDKKYDYFLADTVVPQGIIPVQTNPFSALTFEVLGLEKSTWKTLWKSPPRDRCGFSDRVKVSVKGYQSLELRITCPKENWYCWGVWVEPRLVLPGGEPVAGSSPLDKLDPEKIAAGDRWAKIPELVAVLKGPKSASFGIAFSPDSEKLACACDEGQLYFWDLAGGKTNEGIPLGPMGSSLAGLAFSADGKKLATASQNLARIYDASLPVPKSIREIPLKVSPYPGVAWSPDGNTLAVTDRGGVRLLDWIQDKERPMLQGHAGPVRTVYFSRDGKLLLSAGPEEKSGRVIVWDMTKNPPMPKGNSSFGGQQIWHAVFSPDATKVAFGAGGGNVWMASSPKLNTAWTKKEHRQIANSVCFAPDGKSLISTEGGFSPQGPHYLVWWNAENGEVLKKWELPERCSQGVFAPSGMYVALTNHNHKVYILRLKGD